MTRFRFLLLRLLLCLALVANGASAVYAGARMVFDGGAGTASAAHDAELPCHDMAAMADDAMAADHDTPSPPASHDDCCPPGACLCSCVSHAQTIMAINAIALATRPASAPVSEIRVSLTSPVLPHLIRPPIG